MLKENKRKSFEDKMLRITDAKALYKIIGKEEILSLFLKHPIEIMILKLHWGELKSLEETSIILAKPYYQVRRIYNASIRKLQSRILAAAEYQTNENNKRKVEKVDGYDNYLSLTKDNQIKLKEKSLNLNVVQLNGISTKCAKALQENGIYTVNDLLQYSSNELLLKRKLGKYFVTQIQQSLLQFGLKLG